jgi:uncharacterized protein (DUF983 family)
MILGAAMGKCPNCGNKGLFGPEIFRCIICGKERCEKCGQDLGYLLTLEHRDKEKNLKKTVVVCVEKCYSDFESMIYKKFDLAEQVGTDGRGLQGRIHEILREACYQVIRERDPKLINEVTKKNVISERFGRPQMYYDIKLGPGGGLSGWPLYEKCYSEAVLLLAKNLEASGRLLDAADIYDRSLGMYDKARQLREKEKQVIVKRTDISVNLNDLLKQVKDGGIVVVYRCPHCGGNLKVSKDTSVDSLKICPYCSTEIEAMDLADFLRTALS